MPEEMSNIEGGSPTPPEASSSTEKPISQRSFREVFALEKRLGRQRETASGDALTRIETELAEVGGRKNQLIAEVEQESGFLYLDQNLKTFKLMSDVGELSPSDILDALKIAPQLDNLAGLEPSDPHAGVREWYYRMKLDEIVEELRDQKGQTLRGQKRQPRAQSQPVQPPIAQQKQPLNSPDEASTEAEVEIFGRTEAFSERWVVARGMPAEVRYFKGLVGEEDMEVGGSTGIFNTAELFSTILETGGKDYRANRQLAALFEAYKGDSRQRLKFSSSVVNGFVALASLKDALNSSRIDTLAEALRRGPAPQGIAQWLLFDPETRISLALILSLEGYKVADEKDAPGEAALDVPKQKHAFSDHQHISPDEIKAYLEAVRQAVGTDPGVVKLAYYIFRVLGHAHENAKYSNDLIKKYTIHYDKDNNEVKEEEDDDRKRVEYPDRDLAPKDVASFVVRFDDPTKSRDEGNRETNLYFKLPPKHGNESDSRTKNKVFLEDVLEKEGVIGFALSLNRLPAERIVREWSDMQLILDMMDHIADIRGAMGSYAGLDLGRRHAKLIEEMGVPWAKRKLRTKTLLRLRDPKKIQPVREAGLSWKEREKQAWGKVWSDLTGGSRRKKEQ